MPPRTTSSLLYLDAVTVSFDGFRALNSLSPAVEPGEMRAVIGPNGAGKTTMMDVATGKTRPDEGDVYLDGMYDLTGLDETEIAELGIGRKFQKPTVFESHTVEDNLLLALKSDRRARKTLLWRESAEVTARINSLLDLTRLSALRDRLAGGLAPGQKNWLPIGMPLAPGPKALRARAAGGLAQGKKQGLEIGMLPAKEPNLPRVEEPVAGMTDAETRQTVE